jgi:DNA-binding transcriptional regulator LsrR (DeoR family)
MPKEPTKKGLAAGKRAQRHDARAKEMADKRQDELVQRAEALREAYEEGMTLAALADLLGVSRQRVRQLMAEK